MRRCFLACALVLSCAGGDTGEDREGLVAAYCIDDVQAEPGTVHFTGPRWRLASAEAQGPIVLTSNVGAFIQPTFTSGRLSPTAAEVSRAVGYGFTERHDLIAIGAITVSLGQSSRLEAYAAYQATAWSIREPTCGALLGRGASFEPTGVYFQTVTAFHEALPDIELYGLVEGCDESLVCAPDLGEGADAGAPSGPRPRGNGFFATALNPLLLGVIGRVSHTRPGG